jgi:hypothetical protein
MTKLDYADIGLAVCSIDVDSRGFLDTFDQLIRDILDAVVSLATRWTGRKFLSEISAGDGVLVRQGNVERPLVEAELCSNTATVLEEKGLSLRGLFDATAIVFLGGIHSDYRHAQAHPFQNHAEACSCFLSAAGARSSCLRTHTIGGSPTRTVDVVGALEPFGKLRISEWHSMRDHNVFHLVLARWSKHFRVCWIGSDPHGELLMENV